MFCAIKILHKLLFLPHSCADDSQTIRLYITIQNYITFYELRTQQNR